MLRNLTKKVALITGSTSGIGLSTAKVLARAGSDICLTGFGDPQKIEQIRLNIEKEFNVKSQYIAADLRFREQTKNLIKECQNKLGGLDILVNNAGMQFVSEIENFPDDMYEDILKINLGSYFYSIKEALPNMKKNNWGRIINVASVHGLIASLGKSPYVASKHGVVGLTKTVALETAGHNITVNAICPGFVLTDLIKDQIDAVAKKQNVSFEQAQNDLLRYKQPSQKFIKPEHLGEIILFLCSDAAQEIRGTSINIDGGWVAQ